MGKNNPSEEDATQHPNFQQAIDSTPKVCPSQTWPFPSTHQNLNGPILGGFYLRVPVRRRQKLRWDSFANVEIGG